MFRKTVKLRILSSVATLEVLESESGVKINWCIYKKQHNMDWI